MVEEYSMWMEIGFSLLYLVFIWVMVAAMTRKTPQVRPADRQKSARLIRWAFFALAVGDTFHVGSRVAAFFSGEGIFLRLNILGLDFGVVGWSSFMTAVTVTFFYVFFLLVWRENFQPHSSIISSGLFIIAGIRLGLLLIPGNQWQQPIPVQPWSLIRNIPLMLLGVGVAALLIHSAAKTRQALFHRLGGLMLVSYLFYLPVILFVQSYPQLGLLMIPKTIAYLIMGVLSYQAFFRGSGQPVVVGPKKYQYLSE